ncbi:MAG: hypothetical protein ABFS22_02120 [Pseudomonadota bacterium]
MKLFIPGSVPVCIPASRSIAWTRPHWLALDYKRGEWQADFGYADMA